MREFLEVFLVVLMVRVLMVLDCFLFFFIKSLIVKYILVEVMVFIVRFMMWSFFYVLCFFLFFGRISIGLFEVLYSFIFWRCFLYFFLVIFMSLILSMWFMWYEIVDIGILSFWEILFIEWGFFFINLSIESVFLFESIWVSFLVCLLWMLMIL